MTERHSLLVSRTIRAPLRFVYDWCTDYRESDPKVIFGSKSKRKMLVKNKDRVIYVQNYASRDKPTSAVEVITLHPPNIWHLDSIVVSLTGSRVIGVESYEVGDYVLTSLGPRKTKLVMKFMENYEISKAPTKADDVALTHRVWDKIVPALERDYARKTKRHES